MIELKKFSSGFEYIEVTNCAASAKIALQGAHIFEYTRPGKEDILWLSSLAKFEKKFPIRGGIPICWPWFGPNKENSSLPQHGFARISQFSLFEHKELDEKTTFLCFKLTDSEESKKLWPYSFELLINITISDTLHVDLETVNTDMRAFKITQALHTYFSVLDITKTNVLGVEQSQYFDQLSNNFFIQDGVISFENEIDRIYIIDKNSIIKEPHREIHLENFGSKSLVVWNPWITKNKKITDMQDGEFTKMLCVETANALDDQILIEPTKSFTLSMSIQEK
jgi:glucose-6-phosphate 1-epimerase